jgi:hypothetical protein
MSPVRPDVRVVGRRDVPSDHALRDFLTRAAQPFDWFEAGTEAADEQLAARGVRGAPRPGGGGSQRRAAASRVTLSSSLR